MNSKQTLIAGVLAGIGASLGIGGAWMATLTAFEPARPWFIGLSLLFIGLTFHKLYLTTPTCESGKPCADEDVIRRQRLIFWSVTVPLLSLLAFPWFAPLVLLRKIR